MRFLESFSDRNSDDNLVNMWLKYLDDNYTRFGDTDFGRMVQVGDKSFYLKNKGFTKIEIFNHINSEVKGKKHEPSLKKAIKIWIDRNNI